MKRWWIVLTSIVIFLVLTGFGLNTFKKEVRVPEALLVKAPAKVHFPVTLDSLVTLETAPPFLDSGFIGFREALAFKESQGNYFVVNEFGYLGKYQFGIETLQLMGVHMEKTFLNNPKLQEHIFKLNVARNKWILRKDIARYVGKNMGGIEITESGIIAAAHLAGAGNVKHYLRSFGEIDVSDGFGSSISKYIKKFKGYDISAIPPLKNPRI
ncbi:hypothetical protein [Maribacter sp. 2307ULW6-5]|uniref:hypothetical protein n=1 Tax=Maribacter sp. 2307ULW6-5 TaxID=3386275 RepID=UPI0039BD3AC3